MDSEKFSNIVTYIDTKLDKSNTIEQFKELRKWILHLNINLQNNLNKYSFENINNYETLYIKYNMKAREYPNILIKPYEFHAIPPMNISLSNKYDENFDYINDKFDNIYCNITKYIIFLLNKNIDETFKNKFYTEAITDINDKLFKIVIQNPKYEKKYNELLILHNLFILRINLYNQCDGQNSNPLKKLNNIKLLNTQERTELIFNDRPINMFLILCDETEPSNSNKQNIIHSSINELYKRLTKYEHISSHYNMILLIDNLNKFCNEIFSVGNTVKDEYGKQFNDFVKKYNKFVCNMNNKYLKSLLKFNDHIYVFSIKYTERQKFFISIRVLTNLSNLNNWKDPNVNYILMSQYLSGYSLFPQQMINPSDILNCNSPLINNMEKIICHLTEIKQNIDTLLQKLK